MKLHRNTFIVVIFLLVTSVLVSACGQSRVLRDLNPEVVSSSETTGNRTSANETSSNESAVLASTGNQESLTPTVQYTLQTELGSKGMVFVGVGGEIDGLTNPSLTAEAGDVVEITLVNGDGMQHDISFPDLNATSDDISQKGTSTVLTFQVEQDGDYVYYCTVPGHRQAGMEGRLTVGAASQGAETTAPSIALDPSLVPAPIGARSPEQHELYMETIELEGQLSDGTTFTYFTFDGTVPGPFLRIRVGDTVDVTLHNREDSQLTHSIDFHAVTGPGGGAAVTQVAPGESKSFSFKALNPGLYVYHCATPMVAHHIANGMYGLILVEPEEGLPQVDREFYVMQGEIYTQGKLGEKGLQEVSIDKLLDETPDYFVFNGAVGALTSEYPLTARVGETVRIYFGVGGPNFVSSFHVIGEIFDRVYDQASITSLPLTDVQTTLVPPGGATVVDFQVDVPGRYILVDHALSRAERGLLGFLVVEGEESPEIFHSDEAAGESGH
jgi:nitrite reductase (NO-forming)